jgi:peptide/nickel transport system substrate-binding protein
MSPELKYLAMRAAACKLDRRAVLGRAAAMGVSGAFASTLLSTTVLAAGPTNGGTIRFGQTCLWRLVGLKLTTPFQAKKKGR